MPKPKLLVITIALLIAAPAMAQVVQTGYYATPWGPMFTSMDECHDAAAMPDLAVMDRDSDDRVSKGEFENMAGSGATVSLFDSIDRNKDGFISRQEMDAYRHVGRCREVH